MCVQIIFISVEIAEWSPFGKELFTQLTVCSLCDLYLSLVVRKPVFGISDLVRHKPGCTATEDCKRLEISDLGSRGIILSV